MLETTQVTYGYRLYRGETFCRLEVGFADIRTAREIVDEAFKQFPDYFTHALITSNHAIIQTVNNDWSDPK